MAKTVVGLFDTAAEAQNVVQSLVNGGFTREDISILANNRDGTTSDTAGSATAEGAGAGAVGGGVLGGVLGLLVGVGALAIPGIGPVLAAGPLAAALGAAGASTLVGAGIGAAAGGIIGALVGAGIPEEDAGFYAEGVRRGGTLVMVKSSDEMAQQAYDIMTSAGAVDVERRGSDWRSSGWTGFNPNDDTTGDNAWERSSKVGTAGGTVAGAATGAAMGSVGGPVGTVVGGAAGAVAGAVAGAAGDTAGKKAEEGTDTDTSWNERAVGSSGSSSWNDADAIGSRRSQADYDTGDRARQVRDEAGSNWQESSKVGTVGGTVAGAATGAAMGSVGGPIGTVAGGLAGAAAGAVTGAVGDTVGESAEDRFRGYDSDFRTHYQSYGTSSGYSYDQYLPVYRYGYNLANDPAYQGRDWGTIESDARTRWEERNPGTWDRFKDSVRYAWDKARSKI